MIQIDEARLVADARARHTRSGWTLQFDAAPSQVEPGETPATFRANWFYGQGEAAGVACRNKAHCMRKGTRVSVKAAGGRGRVVLSGVLDVALPDLDVSLHQRIAP